MKKLITMTIMVLAVAAAMAQAPEKFTYQAVVRNASNSLVANAPVGVRVSILQGSASGSAVYVETQTATTNANGLVTLSIGGGNVQQGAFADIDWANGPYFLKTETDPNGGSNYSITTTQQMLSVPYALYAKEAGNIPTVPANVSAFTNDAGYITGYTETDPTVPAWAKEANKPTYNYSEIVNTPELPTVPTNVSAFTNDAGYLTNYTETDPTVPAWAKEANKPTYNYSEIVNTPTIPTVPTNVSAFTNDVGYITTYTETDPQFNAWDKNYNDLTNKPVLFDGDYNSLTNQPTIPTVPTNVSAFMNDAGYLTEYTEQQVLSISNDTIFLTGGSFVKLPAGFDGDYNSLTNTPTIPTVPDSVSAFINDAGYITMADIQVLLDEMNHKIMQLQIEQNDPESSLILRNFALNICGCTTWWDDDAFVGVRRIDPNGDFRADGVRGLARERLVLGDDARGLRERPAVARVFGAAIAVGILDAVSVNKSVARNVPRLADVPIRPAYEDGRLNFVPREGFFRELGLVLHEEMHGEAEEEEQRAHGREDEAGGFWRELDLDGVFAHLLLGVTGCGECCQCGSVASSNVANCQCGGKGGATVQDFTTGRGK